MEDSKQNPEDNNSIDSSSNKDQNVNEFTEFSDETDSKKVSEEKVNIDLKEEKLEINKNSLFKRILNDGFDGISSNPNYKMLALLIILLVNLSLFFVIGNVGKAFLRNAGIM